MTSGLHGDGPLTEEMAAPTSQRTKRQKSPSISPKKLDKMPYSNVQPGKRICSLKYVYNTKSC